jgi:hypothetical protein
MDDIKYFSCSHDQNSGGFETRYQQLSQLSQYGVIIAQQLRTPTFLKCVGLRSVWLCKSVLLFQMLKLFVDGVLHFEVPRD